MNKIIMGLMCSMMVVSANEITSDFGARECYWRGREQEFDYLLKQSNEAKRLADQAEADLGKCNRLIAEIIAALAGDKVKNAVPVCEECDH